MDNDDTNMNYETVLNNPKLYSYLVYNFLPELSDPYILQEIEQAPDQQRFVCELVAAWLPWERGYAEISSTLQAIARKQVSQN